MPEGNRALYKVQAHKTESKLTVLGTPFFRSHYVVFEYAEGYNGKISIAGDSSEDSGSSNIALFIILGVVLVIVVGLLTARICFPQSMCRGDTSSYST